MRHDRRWFGAGKAGTRRRGSGRGLGLAWLLLISAAACRPAQEDLPGSREAEPAATAPEVGLGAGSEPTLTPPPDDPTPRPKTADPHEGERGLQLCQELQPALAGALGLAPAAFELRPADVTFPEWGNLLDGCRLSWEGPGADLRWQEGAKLPGARAMLSLVEAGWEEDKNHAEDRPGGFARNYVQGLYVCRLDFAFAPPPGQACAGQDPVTCGLGPAQLDYRIALSCADS